MTLAHTLVEKGLLPDQIVRWEIRRRLADRLRRETGRGVEEQSEAFQALINQLKQSPIALATDTANEQHYEAPTEFFQLVLGRHMKYSGAYWPNDVHSLDDAELRMLRLYAERAGIEDGMSILDLGCGWGSLSLWLAETFPTCRITAVSNSQTQREYIESACRDRSLGNLQVHTQDVNNLSVEGTFDRIISIEMFEHVRNYAALLERIASLLSPDGRLFVHIFTHRTCAYPFEQDDWIGRWFFTEGLMPSDDLLLHFQQNVQLLEHWRVDGRHYARTANAWLANMDANRDRILKIFESHYGPDDAGTWVNRWRIFFMACAELWGYSSGREWMISHYLFRPRPAP